MKLTSSSLRTILKKASIETIDMCVAIVGGNQGVRKFETTNHHITSPWNTYLYGNLFIFWCQFAIVNLY